MLWAMLISHSLIWLVDFRLRLGWVTSAWLLPFFFHFRPLVAVGRGGESTGNHQRCACWTEGVRGPPAGSGGAESGTTAEGGWWLELRHVDTSRTWFRRVSSSCSCSASVCTSLLIIWNLFSRKLILSAAPLVSTDVEGILYWRRDGPYDTDVGLLLAWLGLLAC